LTLGLVSFSKNIELLTEFFKNAPAVLPVETADDSFYQQHRIIVLSYWNPKHIKWQWKTCLFVHCTISRRNSHDVLRNSR